MQQRQYGSIRKSLEQRFYGNAPETGSSCRADPPRGIPEWSHQGYSLADECPETETHLGDPIRLRYSEFVGNTPMIDLSHWVPNCPSGVQLLAKPEFFNPGFSIKDRIAKHILDLAEEQGHLKSGGTVVAASSGNTGASTALFCATRGCKCVITTSDKCSREKQEAIAAYGANVTVCDNDKYMACAANWAKERGWFDMDQYDNMQNPDAHCNGTGREIWEQTHGTVTHVVAAGSTGGTITGIANCLKSQNPDVKVVLADPVGSILGEAVRNNGKHGKGKSFLVEGVGKGSVPGAMNIKMVDEVINVTDTEAFETCHRLAQTEGICAGGSSGLNLFAAIKLAASLEEGTVVTVFPDCGAKYLSKVYSKAYLAENDISLPSSFPQQKMTNSNAAGKFPLYRNLVGDTPLADITHLVANHHGIANNINVFAKVEFLNPAFSAGDRVVVEALDELEASSGFQRKVLCACPLYMCPTAMYCATRGVACVIDASSMPVDLLQAHLAMCEAYGASVVYTPISDPSYRNIRHVINTMKSTSLLEELRHQTCNTLTHVVCDDPSLFQSCIDESVTVIYTSPEENSVLFADNFRRSSSSKQVHDRAVISAAQLLTSKEGLLCGRRGAMNVAVALEFAQSLGEGPACIVAVLSDLGVHDLGTLHSPTWLAQNISV